MRARKPSTAEHDTRSRPPCAQRPGTSNSSVVHRTRPPPSASEYPPHRASVKYMVLTDPCGSALGTRAVSMTSACQCSRQLEDTLIAAMRSLMPRPQHRGVRVLLSSPHPPAAWQAGKLPHKLGRSPTRRSSWQPRINLDVATSLFHAWSCPAAPPPSPPSVDDCTSDAQNLRPAHPGEHHTEGE